MPRNPTTPVPTAPHIDLCTESIDEAIEALEVARHHLLSFGNRQGQLFTDLAPTDIASQVRAWLRISTQATAAANAYTHEIEYTA